MTAAPSHAIGTAGAPPLGLRLASAAASAHPLAVERTIAWRFPSLPPALAAAAAAEWGVTIVEDPDAVDPRSLPGFAALHAHARAEQVVRALARRTNLVLPAASALVIGDGPLAAAIASTLAHGGTRVIRAVSDPIARLRAHLTGVRTVATGTAFPETDLVFVSAEGHPPLTPTVLSGVVIDASTDRSGIDDTGIDGAAGDDVRPGVRRLAARTWVVESPGPFEPANAASARSTRIADLLIALSILQARTTDADAHLARSVLA